MVFFVRSAEQLPCPVCQESLAPFGRRRRVQILGSGEVRRLFIRRLRCTGCRRIHHELPAELVPYKRHEAVSIEQVIEAHGPASVAADESTLQRWRRWFAWWAPYACGCLEAIGKRFHICVESTSALSQSALRGLGRFVGDAPGWLARAVRPVVNAHLFVSTRLAWVST